MSACACATGRRGWGQDREGWYSTSRRGKGLRAGCRVVKSSRASGNHDDGRHLHRPARRRGLLAETRTSQSKLAGENDSGGARSTSSSRGRLPHPRRSMTTARGGFSRAVATSSCFGGTKPRARARRWTRRDDGKTFLSRIERNDAVSRILSRWEVAATVPSTRSFLHHRGDTSCSDTSLVSESPSAIRRWSSRFSAFALSRCRRARICSPRAQPRAAPSPCCDRKS